MVQWMGRGVALALVAVLCASAPSCVATSPGQSQVAQGRLYQSGEPLYDEFFQQLHAAQVAVEQAPAGEAEVRRELGEALWAETSGAPAGAGGAPGDVEATDVEGGALAAGPASPSEPAADASVETLTAEVERRVGEVKWRAKLRVVVDGELGDEGAAVVLQWIGKPRGAEQELGRALERALNAELQILARMRQHRQELERLAAMAQGLEKNVDSVFRRSGLAKRAEVKKNIRDAQALIPLMDGRAQEVSSIADQMVRKLRSAGTTAEQEAAPPPVAPRPPPPAQAPKSPAARPVGPAPAAAPSRPSAPARPAAPAGDFVP